MLRIEREDRIKISYAEHFSVVAIYEGAFDGWYRGAVHAHVAGAIKLKEPGEVHRTLRVHAPFTFQGATFSTEMVAEAASALGLRGPLHFKAHPRDHAGSVLPQLHPRRTDQPTSPEPRAWDGRTIAGMSTTSREAIVEQG